MKNTLKQLTSQKSSEPIVDFVKKSDNNNPRVANNSQN